MIPTLSPIDSTRVTPSCVRRFFDTFPPHHRLSHGFRVRNLTVTDTKFGVLGLRVPIMYSELVLSGIVMTVALFGYWLEATFT